jgi:predicted small secreted protein
MLVFGKVAILVVSNASSTSSGNGMEGAGTQIAAAAGRLPQFDSEMSTS